MNPLRLAAFLLLIWAAPSGAEQVLDRFAAPRGTETLPQGWEPLRFKRPPPTTYSLSSEGGDFFLKAASSASASGLLKKVRATAQETPLLTWRWKVESVLEKAQAGTKSGDDYAARVYVAFAYDPDRATVLEKAKYAAAKLRFGEYPPKAALNYVWDNKHPAGTVMDNAYSNRVKIIVLESGKEKVGRWVAEERNLQEDYRRFFGEEPPPITFIAVMTDTDNTGESAVAYYDDLVLSPAKSR